MKKILFIIAILVTIPTSVFAHVKWFVDSEAVINSTHGIMPFYAISSLEVLIWSAITLAIVLLFSIADKYIPAPRRLIEFAERNDRKITRAVEILVGLFLISITFLWNIILVPEFPIDSIFTLVLGVMQLFVGVFLMFGLIPRVNAVLILGLYACIGILAGWLPFLENVIIASLAVYIYIKNSPSGSRGSKYSIYSVEIVRLGTAVSLITLAITEKLMYPELSLAFLDQHNWNFMQLVGMHWFTNNLFVLSAGFAELIFGIVYVLGYLTRINTAILSSFFASSVVMMFIQFGKWEMEDLVVYAAALVLMFYGHGKTKFFHAVDDKSIWKKRII